VPLKHWEVAQLIAVTPAYLSRLFNQLELEGVIRRDRKAFAIPDLRRLQQWDSA
jgi:CRP-like cAMP-binding protein